MTEVIIPFKPMFREPMLSGKKTATSRTRKYGNVGDAFQAFGAHFILTLVYQYKLDCVAYLLCHKEGFDTPQDFMKAWAKIHPGRGYDPEWEVWVHEFKRWKHDFWEKAKIVGNSTLCVCTLE